MEQYFYLQEVAKEYNIKCSNKELLEGFISKEQLIELKNKYGLKPSINNTQPQNDLVNHPNHYTQGKVECIDALESATINLKGIEAVCTANVIKYMWRWKEKNGTQDLDKAKWYLEKLIGIVKDNKEIKEGE